MVKGSRACLPTVSPSRTNWLTPLANSGHGQPDQAVPAPRCRARDLRLHVLSQVAPGRAGHLHAGRRRRGKAEKALARLQRSRDETMVDAVDLWLAAKKREPGARAGSLASYRDRAGHLRAYFGTMPVRAVRPEHLTRFAADLLAEGYGPATLQGAYAVLTSTLRHAQRRGAIAALPLPPDGPGIPTPRPRGQGLTLAQVEQVIADMPGVWGKVAELILLTGLRWGEAVAIERADIDGAVVHVRRTQTRTGTVNPPRPAPASAWCRSRHARVPSSSASSCRSAATTASPLALVAAMGDLTGRGWAGTPSAMPTPACSDTAGVSLRGQAARMGHGHHYARTLAYGLAAEAGEAVALDKVRAAASPSAAPGQWFECQLVAVVGLGLQEAEQRLEGVGDARELVDLLPLAGHPVDRGGGAHRTPRSGSAQWQRGWPG